MISISILPLNSFGACSTNSNDIYLSDSLSFEQFIDTLKHELAHLFSRSKSHCLEWEQWYGGKCDNELQFIGDIAFNIGNISGIQGVLTDYYLLQQYRKFSQRILGTDGRWEVINETVDGGPGDQLIRLYPTPKGVFPVTVLYIPVVTAFRSPQAKRIVMDMILAEAAHALGMARRKISAMPSPSGSSIGLDGDQLVQWANEKKEKIIKEAIDLGEPLPIIQF